MSDKPLIAVTGASSGIGEAVARAFSKAGHPVLLMARRLDRLEALGLPNAVLRAVDVRDRAGSRQPSPMRKPSSVRLT